MPQWFEAIFLGLVEGITEFIPVSSTAHLLIVQDFLGLRKSDLFNIAIQGGAVLAVVPLFWRQFSGMVVGLREARNRDLLVKLAVAFVITAVGGYILDQRNFKLPEQMHPVAWAMLLGGLVIYAVEAASRRRVLSDEITWPLTIAFGIAQFAAAIFPGASRSGSTIMVAMLMGMARPAATEFTFLLGVPTLLAAGALKLIRAVNGTEMHAREWTELAVGFTAAAISSFVVVKWLIRYVQSHTFDGFAHYRVALGAALLVWLGTR